MGHMTRLAAAATAALVLAAGSASAQGETRPIRPGDVLSGRVEAGDPDAFGRGRFHAYHADLREGERLIATAASAEFDTYLAVGRMAGPVFEPVKENDDEGEGTDSRLRFSAPRTGRYLVLVQSYRADGGGAYTLSLEAAPEPVTGAAAPIEMGGRAEGVLAETDRLDDDRDRFYDVYTFRGSAGQRISASLASPSFDAYLVLGRMENGRMVRVASDDDGGRGTDALLRRTLTEDGEYVLHASSFGPDGAGPYQLALEERPAPSAATRRPLAVGATARGELDEGDFTVESDGSYFEEWSFSGSAGQEVVVRMGSDDFDTYLSVGRMQDGEFRELGSNDDGDEGTDSMLELTLPADGEYVVRANSFAAGETGEYTLRLR